MKCASGLVLVGFLALSLFGFLGMLEAPADTHAARTCLASLAQNGACPPEDNTVASAIFHTNAMKAFTTTVLSDVVALLALAFLLAVFLPPFLSALRVGPSTLAQRITELVSHYRAVRELRLSLVRLEHSPTSF